MKKDRDALYELIFSFIQHYILGVVLFAPLCGVCAIFALITQISK